MRPKWVGGEALCLLESALNADVLAEGAGQGHGHVHGPVGLKVGAGEGGEQELSSGDEDEAEDGGRGEAGDVLGGDGVHGVSLLAGGAFGASCVFLYTYGLRRPPSQLGNHFF